MTMVMLSHPTPPVSELEARQLSIMFSQILSKSCLATIPRLTNSITACDDWQSQIPEWRRASVSAVLLGRKGGEGEDLLALGGGKHALQVSRSSLLTVAGYHEKLVVVGQVVDHDIWVRSNDLLLRGKLGALLEFEITDGAGQRKVPVDTAKVDETTRSGDPGLLTYRQPRNNRLVNKPQIARSRGRGQKGSEVEI